MCSGLFRVIPDRSSRGGGWSWSLVGCVVTCSTVSGEQISSPLRIMERWVNTSDSWKESRPSRSLTLLTTATHTHTHTCISCVSLAVLAQRLSRTQTAQVTLIDVRQQMWHIDCDPIQSIGNSTLFGRAAALCSHWSSLVPWKKRSDTANKGALSSCYSLSAALSASSLPIKLRGMRNTAQWSNISTEIFICFRKRRVSSIISSRNRRSF